MAFSFVKKFWKEISITVLLTLVLFSIVERIGVPTNFEEFYSTFSNVMPIFLALLPLVPAVIAGFLVKRAAGSSIEVLVVPAFALLIAGIIVAVYLIYPLFTLSEMEWTEGYVEQSELMFIELPMEQFKLVTYLQTMPAAIQLAFGYVGMGLIGGALALKINKFNK